MESEIYTIGEFARILGLSPRTIDFYTRQGLLHPEQPERGHGYRHYTEGDRNRVALIKQLQGRKFSLQEIRQVLNSPGGRKAGSAVELMEQVTTDLDRLQGLIQETRSSSYATDQPVLRAVATAALQKATGLCSLLVTLLQDIPVL
jgi:DNA-binding transcriptional MerR regulator